MTWLFISDVACCVARSGISFFCPAYGRLSAQRRVELGASGNNLKLGGKKIGVLLFFYGTCSVQILRKGREKEKRPLERRGETTYRNKHTGNTMPTAHGKRQTKKKLEQITASSYYYDTSSTTIDWDRYQSPCIRGTVFRLSY